jgi:sialidase-1
MNTSNSICILLLACIAPLVLGCAHTATPHSPKDLPAATTVFSKDLRAGVACYRIPALMTAPDGTLVAVADERVDSCGDMDKNRDINIVLRRSADNGVTWSPMATVVDYPDGITASDPSLIADSVTGALWLFYNYMDHNTAPGIYRLHCTKSHDAGVNWDKPVDITAQVTKPEWHREFHFITSGNGIQTRDGRLLHTLVTRQGSYVITSEDHGAHWSLMHTLLTPGDESRIVELDDGSWMVNTRVDGRHDMRYAHVSSDLGKTWESRPEPALVDPACNAGLLTMASNGSDSAATLLIFSNANSANQRANLSIRHSRDSGTTWSKGKTVYAGAAAYSVLAALPDGGVGLLFEKDDYQEIAFVRLSLDWITSR